MVSLPPARPAGPTPQELAETFEVFRRLGIAMRGRFQEAMAVHGLTFPQWLLMKQLRAHGRMTVREIAESMDVSPANVTGILDRLERDGLLGRARSGEDRRVVFVRLTEPGHQKMKDIEDAGYAEVLTAAFAGWTSEDLALLRGLLARLQLPPGSDAPC